MDSRFRGNDGVDSRPRFREDMLSRHQTEAGVAAFRS